MGNAIAGVQAMALGLKVSAATRFTVTALLVPPEVVTDTFTVPGVVKVVVPFPVGTTATIPVSDHADAAGVTLAEILPCVNVTFPGVERKPLPLISIGRLRGLAGVVELLTFCICGVGCEDVLELPPPPPQPAVMTAALSITIEPMDLKKSLCFISYTHPLQGWGFRARQISDHSACLSYAIPRGQRAWALTSLTMLI